MIIIMAGPPGSGKGTQAELLSRELGVPAIVMGDILRREVSGGTEAGKEATKYMERGLLVPDRVVVKTIQKRLKSRDCKRGFILDGFPRNLSQAHALDEMLLKMGKEVDLLIRLNIEGEEIIRRISSRRMCSNCGKSYHLIFNPPASENICDACGCELYLRNDDREETILERIEVYEREIPPMIEHYRHRGEVIDIEGIGSIEEISSRISREVGVFRDAR